MLVVFDSRTGNVGRFVSRLDMPLMKLEDDAVMEEPFVLVTYTTGFGQAPEQTLRFLEKQDNHRYLRGVAASGNRNWGTNFAISADKIAHLYDIPVIGKFELSGTTRDIESFKKEVDTIADIH
ncbi:class Ib ribonucleoside-diphosphate reductase assembly flavoprotein NrdI [Gorillibacterium massiliense]|uniref:class Ib ribonucleoside-diphosphate reductase assembly flavoprotein NrdI n=1 Tax=Gorillibacterium massiliense TaxID=1280390 RepID=UPI0004B3997E|nr:class Ib ribonucleoside-diphosphate reductase assembly flavoprotein NrdI [Gorillibacterium massiliense]